MNQDLESEYLGFMFETFILGQLKAYLNQSFKFFSVYHYTVANSYDVDLVIQTKKSVMSKKGELVCVEVKYGKKFRPEWLKGLRDFSSISKDRIIGRHVVYNGSDRLEIDDVQIWPAEQFLKALFNDELV